jgi:DNA repair exonuclease SbcCD ATPase subunit
LKIYILTYDYYDNERMNKLRITRLKLVNYIGIFIALGKTEFELDFTTDNNDNKLDDNYRTTMFVGKNGSGKSTIMTQLHPFRDSFDNRDILILDGEDGLKEIDIEHKGDFYEIVHKMKTHGSKSFISKNGEELNPNGGVRTFNEIVFDELGIDKDFSKLAKLGSNVKGFVDLSTADRKKYISKFIPDFDDYLKAFETVKEKYKLSNSKIKFIVDELDKIEDIEFIEKELRILNKNLDTIKEEQDNLHKKSGGQQSILTELEKNNDFGSSQDIHLRILKEKQRLADMKVFVINFSNKYEENPNIDELNNIIRNYDIKLTKLEGEIDKEKALFDEDNKKLTEIFNDITKIKHKLTQYEDSGTLDQLEKENFMLEKEKETILNHINSSEFKDVNLSKDEMSREISRTIDKIESFMNYLKPSYTLLVNSDLFDDINLDLFEKSIDSNSDLINIDRNELKLKYIKLEDRLNSKEKRLSEAMGNLKCVEDLKKRPVNCKIDTCPFIAESLGYIGIEEEIEELEKEISEIKKEMSDISKRDDNLSDLYYEFKQYKEAKSKILDNRNDITNIFLDQFDMNFLKFIKENSLLEISKTATLFVNEIEDYLSQINRLENINNRLNVLEPSIKSLRDNYDIIKELNENLNSLKNKKGKLEEKIKDRDLSIKSNKKELNDLSIKKSDYEEFRKSKTEYNDLMDMINELEEKKEVLATNQNTYDHIKEEYDQVLQNIKDNEKSISSLSDELESYKMKKSRIEEYNKAKIELEENFSNLKVLKDSLDPIKGIPIYFMQDYLNKTEVITNKLLDLAFGGKFRISFELGARDFNIKVHDEGITKDDISQASQGEFALTTISLSLALLEQSIKKFNIVTLDEIDGALDENNRNIFIDILDTQMDSLGVEQMFIISHNNAFDSKEMNLILLKNHNVDTEDELFMRNKNVIFNYDD